MSQYFTAVFFLALTLGISAQAYGGSEPASPSKLTLEDVMPKEFQFAHLVLLRRGRAVELTPEEDEQTQIRHLDYLNRLRDQGSTLAHGPFRAPEGAPESFDPEIRGAILFRAHLGRDDIDRLLAADPWITAGHLIPEVLFWMVPAGSFSDP